MLKKIAYTILILFALSLFGSLIKHVHSGNEIGFLTGPLKAFTSLADILKPTAQELTSNPKQFQPIPSNFESLNELEQDVIILYSQSADAFHREFILKNLRTDSIHYIWEVDYTFQKNDRLFHPILAENKSVIFQIDGEEKVLMKIDSTGNLLYKSKGNFIPHHSLNIDSKGYVWAPGKSVNDKNEITSTYEYQFPNGNKISFRDNYLLKYDAETGKLMYKKSFVEIFQENNLGHLLKKAHFTSGPFHSNDIQPVLNSGKYFNVGDVFISIRNMSMIVHYRPEENKIVKIIEGPFTYQHDVDITSDSTITIFNNNTLNEAYYPNKKLVPSNTMRSISSGASQIIRYNYASNKFDTIFSSQIEKTEIFTHHEGLHHWLPSGDLLIEEQEKGVLWILNDSTIKYKNVLPSQLEGHYHMLNWTRVIEN